MDDLTLQNLKALFYDKILRYNDLRRCFQQEKAALIDMDMDCLWNLSREKEEICAAIDEIRNKMGSIDTGSIDGSSMNLRMKINSLPAENRIQLQELYHTIARLKGEIDAMRKENMTYVDTSLQFLDDILSVITGKSQAKALYDDKRQLRKATNTIFLSREV